jgi:hypothetical protein
MHGCAHLVNRKTEFDGELLRKLGDHFPAIDQFDQPHPRRQPAFVGGAALQHGGQSNFGIEDDFLSQGRRRASGR